MSHQNSLNKHITGWCLEMEVAMCEQYVSLVSLCDSSINVSVWVP